MSRVPFRQKQAEVGVKSFRKVFVGVTVTERDVNKISRVAVSR